MFTPKLEPLETFVTPLSIDPTGRQGPTPSQARGLGWQRVCRGGYLPRDVDLDTPEQRAAIASHRLPGTGMLTGWAALRLAGAAYFDGTDRPVLVVVPSPGVRSGAGIKVLFEPCAPLDRHSRSGVAYARPVRALFDEVRQLEAEVDRVVAIDMALAAGVCSLNGLRRHWTALQGWRRAHGSLRLLDLSSERSLSPGESRTRWVWRRAARLPELAVNASVLTTSGEHVATVDLLDVESGLVIEYDGAHHRSALAHARDVHREERLRALGLNYLVVTSYDLHDIDYLAHRMRQTRGASAWIRPDHRPYLVREFGGPRGIC